MNWVTDPLVQGADASVLRANAWCGAPAFTPAGDALQAWGQTSIKRESSSTKLDATEVDYANWRDPAVGWGVVLPDSDAPSPDKARALDAPDCVRALIAHRNPHFAAQGGVPVFRHRSGQKPGYLRHYDLNGTASDPNVRGKRGVGPGAMPWYLLIIGSPTEIPWRVQYRLQLDAYVGRLDLPAAGLEHYIAALLSDWSGASVNRSRPVLWAVDHGPDDITHLMRRTIIEPLGKLFGADATFSSIKQGGLLQQHVATHGALATALTARTPAFIATSSHGATDPTNDVPALVQQLGLPVDSNNTVLDMSALDANWSPYGTLWYAHACCSAGCDSVSAFRGMAEPASNLERTLAALENAGAQTAPLPKRLLGGAKPARAFIGHVEPTFDWTIRDPVTKQVTTAHIVETLYNKLHTAARPPVGRALAEYYRGVGGLWRDYNDARNARNEHRAGAETWLRRAKLMASDREAMVLLGDPTVNVA